MSGRIFLNLYKILLELEVKYDSKTWASGNKDRRTKEVEMRNLIRHSAEHTGHDRIKRSAKM